MSPSHRTAPLWDTSWMRQASCTRSPGLPWTEDDDRIPPLLVDLMADICPACPVFAECEAFADAAEVTAGWWAGASRNDRQPWDYGILGRLLPRRPIPTDDAPEAGVDPDAA